MWPNPQFPADLVLFIEEILNGKLHFLCSDIIKAIDSFGKCYMNCIGGFAIT